MSRSYKNRRRGSPKKYQDVLETPRSKKMKAIKLVWNTNANKEKAPNA